MDQHIAVLGFLLSATVFSVGFLSARIHASYDTCEVEVNGQSWRIRDALLRRERMSPAAIDGSLTVLRRARDTVTVITRIINGLLLAATAALSVDALILMSRGVPAPDHALLLIATVFVGSAAVTAIGEFDVRKVTSDQRAMLSNSLPGRIDSLAAALAAGRYAAVDEIVNELHDAFPDWGLLTEVQAYSLLRQGKAREAYDSIDALVARSDDVYLSHLVGAAAAMNLGDGLAALRILAAVRRRAPHLAGIEQLNRALTLYLGHLPAVMADRTAEVSAPPRRRPRSGRFGAQRHTLDIGIHDMPETARLMRVLAAWESSGSLPAFVKEADQSPLLAAVRAVLPEAGPGDDRLRSSNDPAALETLGMIKLAAGDPREALRIFERAVRLAPAASRLHWGIAVASHRIGWTSAAATSLGRAETLVSHAPIVTLTRDAFEQETPPAPAAVALAFPAGVRPLDRLQLAMIGVPAGADPDRSTVGGRFVGTLLDMALASARASEHERLATA